MAFDSLADFFAMGGYGFYVWLSYGLTFFSFIVLIVNSVLKKNKILKGVELRLSREQRIKKAKKLEGTL